MSLIDKGIATCRKCGKNQEVTIYHSVNVAQNPELKSRILDGSLFMAECPECHQVSLVKYELLYHDPEQKTMIWLMPTGDLPETEMKAISNQTKAMGNYTLRQVRDTGELIEKILIFDAGLDDMVVEMCKYVIKMELCAKNKNEEFVSKVAQMDLHFYKMEEHDGMKALTFMYPEDNEMRALNLGINVYEDCIGIIERNPNIKPEETFMKIDEGWLMSIMK